jgi:hypothetical protein
LLRKNNDAKWKTYSDTGVDTCHKAVSIIPAINETPQECILRKRGFIDWIERWFFRRNNRAAAGYSIKYTLPGCD